MKVSITIGFRRLKETDFEIYKRFFGNKLVPKSDFMELFRYDNVRNYIFINTTDKTILCLCAISFKNVFNIEGFVERRAFVENMFYYYDISDELINLFIRTAIDIADSNECETFTMKCSRLDLKNRIDTHQFQVETNYVIYKKILDHNDNSLETCD